jgi:hypothetical protein
VLGGAGVWSLWGQCEALRRGRVEEETAEEDKKERIWNYRQLGCVFSNKVRDLRLSCPLKWRIELKEASSCT